MEDDVGNDCLGISNARLPNLGRLPSELIRTASFQPDRRQSTRDDEADRRQFPRVEVRGKATLGTSLPDQIEGDLYNLSASGCSIRVSQGAVQVHDEVWFKIDTIEPWKGTVRWVSKQNVGVEFDRPLFQSLFELIAHAHQHVDMSRAA